MDWLTRLEAPQNALAVLTAMITPAVLISACGALIFSTSSRLGRVIDRVRVAVRRFEEMAKQPEQDEMFEERRPADLLAARSPDVARPAHPARDDRLLHRARHLRGVERGDCDRLGRRARNFTWIAVVLGVVGTLFMLYGSVLLIVESRMALGAIMSEMDFVWKVSQKLRRRGPEQREPTGGPFTWLGKRIG